MRIGVVITNADGAYVDLPAVCTVPVTSPTSEDINAILRRLLEDAENNRVSLPQVLSTVTSILLTANSNANVSRSINGTILYDIMVFTLNHTHDQTADSIVATINLFITACVNADFFPSLTAEQRNTLFDMYQQVLEEITTTGNEAAASALISALTSIDQCTAKFANKDNVMAINAVLDTIQQSYINLSTSCEGPPLAQDGSSQTVQVISYFGTSLNTQANYTSGGATASQFKFSDSVVANLANRSCVFLVLTSLKIPLDENRLPPQQLTLYDGATGAEIPIDNEDPNAIHIYFQTPKQSSSNNSCSSEITCQFLDEKKSSNGEVIWSSTGCHVDHSFSVPNYTVCACSHLTYFSALLAGDSGGCGWTWYQIASLTSVAVAAFIVLVAILCRELYLRFFKGDNYQIKARPTLPSSRSR